MRWDGTGPNSEKGVSWKLQNEPDPACAQECVGNYLKGISMPDESASEVLHTYIPGKEIFGTSIPILDRITLLIMGTKRSFANIVRG